MLNSHLVWFSIISWRGLSSANLLIAVVIYFVNTSKFRLMEYLLNSNVYDKFKIFRLPGSVEVF